MSTEKMCIKSKYATEADALEFSARWQRTHPNAAPQYSYRCEECPDTYHLTTQTSESYGLARQRQMNPTKTGSSREDVANRRRMVSQQHRALPGGQPGAAVPTFTSGAEARFHFLAALRHD
jgi:hypothetical protein